MSIIGQNILGGASGQAGGYDIDQSLYMGDAPNSGPKLSRTLTSAGSVNPKWTYSSWFKKGTATTSPKCLFWVNTKTPSAGTFLELSFDNDKPDEQAGLRWYGTGPTNPIFWHTGHNFYDFSAWMHVCQVIDYSNATTPCQFYFNGILAPNTADFWDVSFVGGATGGWATNFSPVSGDVFNVGCNNSSQMLSGYMADTYWIEGQALNPVGTFGEFNEDTGQFVPIEYTGTYAGNSFYLNYSDSADFGADSSGLGNDFTVTSIAATKQMLDTPTNNFPTWNPLCRSPMTAFSEGNLKNTGSNASSQGNTIISISPPATGKWYFEFMCPVQVSGYPFTGTVDATVYEKVGTWQDAAGDPGDMTGSNGGWRINTSGSYETDGGGDTAGGQVPGTTDILQYALDHDNGALYYGINNTWYTPSVSGGDPTSGASRTGAVMTWTAGARSFIPAVGNYNGSIMIMNAGQDSSFAGEKTAQGNKDGNDVGDFYYTPPAGYLALCSNNLPDPSVALPGEHFNTLLWTGDGSAEAVTGAGFAPDLIWGSGRSNTNNKKVYDQLRGISYALRSNTDGAESYSTTENLSSFDSDGFTIKDPDYINNGYTFVAWNWKAGGTTSANTDGDISSTVSVNTTARFSIYTYTGNATAGNTVGHGLGVKPDLIIVKKRTGGGGAGGWYVYNSTAAFGVENYLVLNTTAALDTGATGFFHDTEPTASVITMGNSHWVNGSTETYVGYCFANIEGYSKVGTYTGNGNADGTFIYTGFKPTYVLTKQYNTTNNWYLQDGARNPYNPVNKRLNPNLNDAEYSGTVVTDYVSNGFKIRHTDGSQNTNGGSYLYIAFAESPFKTSNAR